MFMHNNILIADPPAQICFNGFLRRFSELTREEWDELGYNEAVPLQREPFTDCRTQWVKGADLVMREEAYEILVDEAGRYAHAKATKQAEICSAAETFMLAQIDSQYGPIMRETWPLQSTLAEVSPQGLEAMVAARKAAGGSELTVEEQAAKILANRESWGALSMHVAGMQNGYQDQLDLIVAGVEGAADPDYKAAADAIEAIAVGYVKPTA